MSDLSSLEHRIRRSSSFSHPDFFQDYMQYAPQCRDQIEVYYEMEDNKIGIDEPKFWLALLQTLKLRCQLLLIVKRLSEIKKNHILKQHQDFSKILQFQENLANELEITIRQRKNKRRRSVKELEIFSISKIQKKKRKVGGMEIYVDEQYRQNYRLEDYSEFFQTHLQDQIQYRRLNYQRAQQAKPLSYLGQKRNNFQKWSFQLIQKKPQNSVTLRLNQRVSTSTALNNANGTRFSISRKSNLISDKSRNNPESNCFQTPKVSKDQDISMVLVTTPKQNKQKMDYDELLKSYKKSFKTQQKGPHELSSQQSECKQRFNGYKDDFFGQDDQQSVFSGVKQIIRVKKDENDEKQGIFGFQHQLDMHKESSVIDRDQLNRGRLESDDYFQYQSDQTKQDKELQQMIQTTQLQTLQTLQNLCTSHRSSIELQQKQFQNITEFQDEQSFSQTAQRTQSNILSLNALQSTQTFQSVDSNQENVFTSNKIKKQHQLLNPFRKHRKPFQILIQEQLVNSFGKNQDQANEVHIMRTDNNDTSSIDGKQCIQQMIKDIQLFIGLRPEQGQSSRNIVLETLRKKKTSTILASQTPQTQKEPAPFTNSQKRIQLKQLSYISEQKSYNSERKNHSRQRFSSGWVFGKKANDENQTKVDMILNQHPQQTEQEDQQNQ